MRRRFCKDSRNDTKHSCQYTRTNSITASQFSIFLPRPLLQFIRFLVTGSAFTFKPIDMLHLLSNRFSYRGIFSIWHGISPENKLNICITLRILGTTVQSSYPKYLQQPKVNKNHNMLTATEPHKRRKCTLIYLIMYLRSMKLRYY